MPDTPPAARVRADRAADRLAIVAVDLRYEEDLVLARQRARQVAGLLGFDAQDQTRIATAVSEVARNAFRYAGGGRVTFALGPAPDAAGPNGVGPTGLTPSGTMSNDAGPAYLAVRVEDAGPGIADLAAVLEGRYQSTTGMGVGLAGARRLSDAFDVRTAPGQGTRVTLARRLPGPPRGAPTPVEAGRVAEALARAAPPGALEEARAQNRELLAALDALRERQAEVERLNAALGEANAALARTNHELGETNRGVLALYAELDERAEALRRGSELKSRFLSDVSHELRTPLTSILNLTRLLADLPAAALADEPRRAVHLVRKSAQGLTDIVNDLLDLAKIEAGRAELRPGAFTAADLLAALRGVCRPLATNDAVALRVDEPPAVTFQTDEGRLAQVLRNLVGNALKYTEAGEVRVTTEVVRDSATADEGAETVRFVVRDTGVGIAAEDQGRVFDEFTQVEGPHQRRVKGTGLGLPLSRRLAALLGGTIAVESAPGVGSAFTVEVPRVHPSLAGPRP